MHLAPADPDHSSRSGRSVTKVVYAALSSAIVEGMGDDEAVEKAREEVRARRVAYEEALASHPDVGQVKELKTALNEAEAELVRVKRALESAPPGHLL